MKDDDLQKIIDAVKDCFKCLTACDGLLTVNYADYNRLVSVINSIAKKPQ